ncbi:glycosyltransferase family 2 protein [Gangjinia marincola]|uniref:Glycosyltransferase family 2 protein n=1 Tax=Gangjinia marincola TaxID=578463 RepID=A0ABN1MDP5_9FLAO
MDKSPFFSVVITVYNKEDYIKETIQSVLDQTFTDFELIIVDDYSTDNSRNIIKSYQTDAITPIYNETNLGAGASRNVGVYYAKGNYIALLDGDDLYKPFFLEEIHLAISKYPNNPVFAMAAEKIKDEKIFKYSYSFPPSQDRLLTLNYFESSYQNTILTSSSTVIQKDFLLQLGGYDEGIKSGQDTDLWIRIGLQTSIIFDQKIGARIRFIENSLFNTTNTLKDKLIASKFKQEEERNPALKKFMDLNRFSLVILGRLNHQYAQAKAIQKQIDPKNLTRKQRFLLRLPLSLLKISKRTKEFLDRQGWRFSSFK